MLRKLKICCLFLMFSLFGKGQGTIIYKNGYVHVPEANAWLRLHRVPATWKDARLQCLLEGGDLASPTNEALANAMKSLSSKVASVLTGIEAAVFKNDFLSLDGEPLLNHSLTWSQGDPNNWNNSEDCLIMNCDGTVADVSCDAVYPYICHKDNTKICGTKDTDYVYEPSTGSCYKFHLTPRTWREAASACVAEGAHLAIINSPIESQILKQLFADYKDPMILTSVHIGFRNWNVKGEWLTIFGIPLAEAGFDSWYPGNPDNYKGEENCGSMKTDGRLNDVDCTVEKLSSICEISLPKVYLWPKLDLTPGTQGIPISIKEKKIVAQ